MHLVSDIQQGEGRKISFSDLDDWGYTSKGIVFTTDVEYRVTGLELYSARFGVMRFTGEGHITYCQGWESDHVKTGIGINDHFATKLIGSQRESHELLDKIYNQIHTSLKAPYLSHVIHKILKDGHKITLDPASINNIQKHHGKAQEKTDSKAPLKRGLFGRLRGD